MGEMIRVLLGDDHAAVRQGLRALLETEEAIEVVAEARDGIEALRMAMNFIPDVILLDLLMPRKNGFEVIPQIRQEVPHARILVLTSFGDEEQIFAACAPVRRGMCSRRQRLQSWCTPFTMPFTASRLCTRQLRVNSFAC
jgi:DNA-binding NarL/FixJ family response regulator